ncbi:hypothetical protein [Pyrodictium occultum]|uniref:hypothetical protein n=1 Tax=Pyrodictium occultum TaxID=2309 RepID=UPI00071E7D7C|nr:hypothetical protein [Pyrodictium occultum]
MVHGAYHALHDIAAPWRQALRRHQEAKMLVKTRLATLYESLYGRTRPARGLFEALEQLPPTSTTSSWTLSSF